MTVPSTLVSWFEIPAVNFARACRFCEMVLNIELELDEQPIRKLGRFAGQHGQPGGAVVLDRKLIPGGKGVLVYLGVGEPVDIVLERVVENGGSVLKDTTNIGPWGTLAVFRDCEGNRVGVHRWRDKPA